MADNRAHIVLTAADQTRGAFASAEAGLAGLKASAGALNATLGSFGAAFSVAALAGFVKGTIDGADAMHDMATRTGTSVAALASYELAAKQSGTSVEALAAAMGKLSVFMAKNADEARVLGLTAKDPAQAFAQLADVIGAIDDPAQRNALAMQVLGKSYAEVMPLLAQGGDALRAQSEAAAPYAERMAALAQAADQFNDSLAALGQNAQSALLPLVNGLVDASNAAFKAAEGLQGMDATLAGIGSFGTAGQAIAVTWANVAYVFEQTGNEIGGIAAQLAALGRGDFKGAAMIGDTMKREAEKARAELDALEKRIMQGPPKIQAIPAIAADFVQAQERAISGLTAAMKYEVEQSAADFAKLQPALAKAFDTKPLDDFLASFKDRRRKIAEEHARLKADLEGTPIGEATSSLDLSYELTKGRAALSMGDTDAAKIAGERARQMLDQLRANGETGLGYYADQIQQYRTAMVDAEEKTATDAAAALKRSLDKAAAEVAQMDPLKVPLATEAIANDLRATIAAIRQELAANPLQVPVVATAAGGLYSQDLRAAATAAGAR